MVNLNKSYDVKVYKCSYPKIDERINRFGKFNFYIKTIKTFSYIDSEYLNIVMH